MPYLKNKTDGQIMFVTDGFMTQGLPEGWDVFDMAAYIASKSETIDQTEKVDTIDLQGKRPGRPRKVVI